jgi:ATP-dependent Lon protease
MTQAISPDPLPPGSVYTVAIDADGKVGLFRLEVSLTAGKGKVRTPTGLERGLKESLNRAAGYFQSVKEKLGLTAPVAQKDIYAEAVDLTGARVECACGVAFFVAIMSAVQNRRIQAGTVVMGDLTVQGNLRASASITEPLQVALDNGATRALIPTSNKAQFTALPEEVAEKLEIVFFGDPDRAVLKTIEVSRR